MTFHRSFIAAALVAVGSLASSISLAQAPNPRIALVIGDAAYPDHPLATTANDAGLVAQTLQAAGFDVVGAADLDQNSLRGALRDFLDKAAAVGPDMQALSIWPGAAFNMTATIISCRSTRISPATPIFRSRR